MCFKDERETYLLSKGWVRELDGYWIHPESLNLTKLTMLEAYNYEIGKTPSTV